MIPAIRPERPSDEDAIEQVTRRAFRSHPYSHQTEQFIIRALRAAQALSIPLVAEDAGRIVLVGDPSFYTRFGFANNPGLVLEGVPPEFLLAQPLGNSCAHGMVRFHPAFQAAG